MSTSPLISVVTVCFNAGYELDKTVESVLNQDYDNFEYIIKDGGSTDGSIERLPNDRRIRVIQKEDDGIFDAMNQSLEKAKGKYINFLNAGDLFYDEKIISHVEEAYNNNPEIKFFYGDYISKTSKMGLIRIPKKLGKLFLFSGTLCHQTWFLSRETQLNYGGYSTKHKTGGDYLMLLDLIFEKDIPRKKINKILIVYKGDGVSSKIDNVHSSLKARERKRKEVCTKTEYFLLSILVFIKEKTKQLLYNTNLYKIVKKYRTFLYNFSRKN